MRDCAPLSPNLFSVTTSVVRDLDNVCACVCVVVVSVSYNNGAQVRMRVRMLDNFALSVYMSSYLLTNFCSMLRSA